MGTQRLRTLVLTGLAGLALLLAACTRSASTPPPAGGIGDETPGELSAQQATMEAVRSTLLTQTAQAGGVPVATETPDTTEETATPQASPTVVVVASPTSGSPSTYTLRAGEHPYCIARRFNVNPDELLSASNLSRTSVTYPGTTLTIPRTGNAFPGQRALLSHPTTYTVLSGETIYSIACKYGDVDPIAIAQANNLTEPYTLTAGQSIQIP